MKSILEKLYPEYFRFLHEGKIPLLYIPYLRTFGIRLIHTEAYQQLYYCPWSGKKFPQSLEDIYFATLEKIKVEPYEREKIPPQMQNEEWWVDLGLD